MFQVNTGKWLKKRLLAEFRLVSWEGEALSSSYSLASVRAAWKMNVFCSHFVDCHKSQGHAGYWGSVSYTTTFLESCVSLWVITYLIQSSLLVANFNFLFNLFFLKGTVYKSLPTQQAPSLRTCDSLSIRLIYRSFGYGDLVFFFLLLWYIVIGQCNKHFSKIGSMGRCEFIEVPFSYWTDVTGCSCMEDGTCSLIALLSGKGFSPSVLYDSLHTGTFFPFHCSLWVQLEKALGNHL